ncbi:unnamed protein product [Rotaria sordida]|uniref:Uncharacterized protein n=1 Tax=Rotaria sordida TaxID=392033 RepID=A0A818RZS1_9BILA|nr:unnamed protein product [Rotaria sordida]CAF1029753.1 unnamed protein product [Rotaria sordida]CAF3529288.1 unnamed protein product [Rotaria sordida]CAF3661847.1 unnamed protein product [Rotaria sordida]
MNGHDLNQHIDIDKQLNINNDLTSHDGIDQRSVLWPKICFKTLLKRNNNPYQYKQHGYYKFIFKRNLRKCYPFDTV